MRCQTGSPVSTSGSASKPASRARLAPSAATSRASPSTLAARSSGRLTPPTTSIGAKGCHTVSTIALRPGRSSRAARRIAFFACSDPSYAKSTGESPLSGILAPPAVLARAAGHRRQDHERVAVLDGRFEPVEHAHVLVVQVDVHVAVQLAVLAEQLALGLRVLRRERAQHLADVLAVGLDFLRAARRVPEDRGDLDDAHAAGDCTNPGCLAGTG